MRGVFRRGEPGASAALIPATLRRVTAAEAHVGFGRRSDCGVELVRRFHGSGLGTAGHGRIGAAVVGRAAGLDVLIGEPRIDPGFAALDNVVLRRHHGSVTVNIRRAMGRPVRDDLVAHFAGRPPPTPVI